MPKNELTFTFTYSEDGGSTWLPASPPTFKVRDWDAKILNEELVTHILDDANEIVRFYAARVRLRIVVDVINFFPTVDTDHANYVWLQKWLARSGRALLRISHDSGEKLDGLSLWESATNSYYVVPQPENEADKENADWRKLEILFDLAEELTI